MHLNRYLSRSLMRAILCVAALDSALGTFLHARPTHRTGAAIAVALAEAAGSSRLAVLDLRENDLSDLAACAFGTALAAQGALCCCYRGDCSGAASDDADRKFHHPGLRELELMENPRIGAVGARGLAAGVRAAGRWVESVGLELCCGVGAEGAAALQAAAEAWGQRWAARCSQEARGPMTPGGGEGGAGQGGRRSSNGGRDDGGGRRRAGAASAAAAGAAASPPLPGPPARLRLAVPPPFS